jgi:hypothetical protein
MPIIFNGVLIGIIASVIALVIYGSFVYYFSKYFELLYSIGSKNFYYSVSILFLIGPFLGFWVSIFSLRKVSLKI